MRRSNAEITLMLALYASSAIVSMCTIALLIARCGT